MESLSTVFVALSVTLILVIISSLLYYLSTQSSTPFTPSVLAVETSGKKGKKASGKIVKETKKKKKPATTGAGDDTGKPPVTVEPQTRKEQVLTGTEDGGMYSKSVRVPNPEKMLQLEIDAEVIVPSRYQGTGWKDSSWKRPSKLSEASGDESEPKKSILRNRGEQARVAPRGVDGASVQLPHWKHPKDEVELSHSHHQQAGKVGKRGQVVEPVVPVIVDNTETATGKKKKKNKRKAGATNDFSQDDQNEMDVSYTKKNWSTVSGDRGVPEHRHTGNKSASISATGITSLTAPSSHSIGHHHYNQQPISTSRENTWSGPAMTAPSVASAQQQVAPPTMQVAPVKVEVAKTEAEASVPKGPSKQVLELEAKIKKLQVQIQKRESQIMEVQQRLASAIPPSEIQRLNQELARQAQEKVELQKNNEILQSQFANNVSVLVATNRQQDTLKHNLERAMHDKEMTQDELNQIKGVLARKDLEITELNKRRLNVAADSKALQDAEERFKAVSAENSGLQNRVTAVENELRQLQQINQDKDAELKSVKQELYSSLNSAKFRESGEGQEDMAASEYQANLTTMKTQIGDLELQVNRLMQDIDQEKTTNSDLKNRLETARVEAQNRETEWRQQANIVISLQSQIDELTKEKKTVDDELELSRSQFSAMSEKLRLTEKNVSDFQERFNEQAAAHVTASGGNEEEIKRLKEELSTAQERCLQMEKEAETLKSQLQHQNTLDASGDSEPVNKEMVDQLRQQLDSVEKELACVTHQREDLTRQLEDQKTDFEEQLMQRKKVLNETESVLEKLQQSVEEEEAKWKGLIEQTETECHQVKSTSEARIKELESHLEEAERSCVHMKSDISQLSEKLSQAECALESPVKKEEVTTGELAEQNTRLTDLLQETQAALEAETCVVADLRKQMTVPSSVPLSECQQRNGTIETSEEHGEKQEVS